VDRGLFVSLTLLDGRAAVICNAKRKPHE